MDDVQLIKNLIKEGESEQLEFKEAVRKEDIAKALCAFLNAKGGTVIIGVKDNGVVTGVKDADKHETELKNYFLKAIIPEAPVTVYTQPIGKKNVILAKVWNGSKPPYVFDGTIYYRKDDRTSKATPNDISKLIIERQQNEAHWERQPALGVSIDDLDEMEIRRTLKDLEQYGKGKAFKEKQVKEFLTYYNLYNNGNLTNAAVILFAKEPARFIPQSRIRLTVLKKSKTSDTFSYDNLLEGNLFSNIKDVMQFFDVNIAVKSKFSDKKWLRQDEPFPRSALREGLLNALIHRDYSSVSGTVLIAFYPDRLEITNSGILYGGYKPSDLTRNHLSVPRNPDIAHICFLRQMIEKIGRGTIKMIEDCESKGFDRPKWESKSGTTTLTFPGITVTAKTDTKSDAKRDTKNDTVNDTVSDTVNAAVKEGIIDAISDTVIDTLSDTVKVALAGTKGVTLSQIMKKTGKSIATIKRYLQILNKLKLVEFKGAAKTGRYFVTKVALNRIAKRK